MIGWTNVDTNEQRSRSTTRGDRETGLGALPRYDGQHWVGGALPTHAEPWLRSIRQHANDTVAYEDEATREAVDVYLRGKPWVWPGEQVYLLCDVHADADAFMRSLVASGGVAKTGPSDADFELTAEGAASVFLIAGDCLDKGPSNLRLLRCLKRFIDRGARVVLLAGNHDVRAMVGMRCVGQTDPRLAHLFVRMGKKAVPLFREIYDTYLDGRAIEESLAEESRHYQRLFPQPTWYREFPRAVGELISTKKIEQELIRIREKVEDMERCSAKLDLSLAKISAVVDAFHKEFLTPQGEHAWFFERMQLVQRAGSVLFVHAGIDDRLAARLHKDGVDGVNAWFRALMQDDLFELYHGPIGNSFRTKYRDTDLPLTASGVRDLHDIGVYAVVHGHRNILRGQRIVFREGMLNFECDASIDCNTRAFHDMNGVGAAVTIFRPDGQVVGISTDHHAAKVFDAAQRSLVTIPQAISACDQERKHPMASKRDEHEDESEHEATDEEVSEMSDSNNDGKINFESSMTRAEAVAYFEAIVKGLKGGVIHLRRNDEALTLEAGAHLDVEVKAARKSRKQKIEIELSWRTDKPVDLEID